MRLLLVHHRLPYPLHSGMDKLRYNLIKTLNLVHDVTLIVPVPETDPSPGEAIDRVKGICRELITVPVNGFSSQKVRLSSLKRWFSFVILRVPFYISDNYREAMADRLRQLSVSGRFDVIHFLSNVTGSYLPDVGSEAMTVLGPMDDTVESAWSNARVAPSPREKLAWWLHYRARRKYQPAMCRRAGWTYFHSDEDLRRIDRLSGGLPNARVLPVALDHDDEAYGPLSGTNPPEQEPNSVIFVGGLGSYFNVDAVLHFHKDILPRIHAGVPAVKVYIVGQNPPDAVKQLAEPGRVVVTGTVPDVRPYIRHAAVYVIPLRAGTGVKTKTVEAMSLGKAIVTTPLGLAGLWDVDNTAFRVCSDPRSFADAVVTLLADRGLRTDLGNRARALWEKSYAFDVVAQRTLRVYSELERHVAAPGTLP